MTTSSKVRVALTAVKGLGLTKLPPKNGSRKKR
jgi:hypothetical protein